MLDEAAREKVRFYDAPDDSPTALGAQFRQALQQSGMSYDEFLKNLEKEYIKARVQQAGNSIGGAISADGALVAAQNYVPGGVKGTLSRSLVKKLPGTRCTVGGIEYGTHPVREVLGSLRADNWLYAWGDPKSAQGKEINREVAV